MFFSSNKREMYTANRVLTTKQQNDLYDYVIHRVVKGIRTDFKDKIDAANESGYRIRKVRLF